jgi:hypothetical protein
MAATTFPPDFVFEKLHPAPTSWACSIKDIPWLPKPHILTWAFHISSPFILNLTH